MTTRQACGFDGRTPETRQAVHVTPTLGEITTMEEAAEILLVTYGEGAASP